MGKQTVWEEEGEREDNWRYTHELEHRNERPFRSPHHCSHRAGDVQRLLLQSISP